MSPFDHILIIYGFKEIYGVEGRNLNEIILEVSKYNRDSLLEVIAKVTLKLSCGTLDDYEIQYDLIKAFFGTDVAFGKGLAEKIKRENALWVVFVEQSTLYLLNLCLGYSQKKGGLIVDESRVHDVGILLLEITDVCVPNYAGDYSQIREFLTRQFFLMSNERLMYRIARFRLMFEAMVSNNTEFDIAGFFEKASNGKSFPDYLNFCFCLMIKWINLKKDKVNILNDWVVSKKKYFSLTKLPEHEIVNLTSLLVVKKDEYQTLTEKYTRLLGAEEFLGYDYMVLRKFPFVEFDSDRFICPSPSFLMDKATEGVYWIVEEYLRENNLKSERNLFPNLWGTVFESYINDRLKGGFGQNYVENLMDGDKEICDGLIIGQNCIMPVETKYTHWSYKAKTTGKKIYMESVLKQLFSDKKGLGQLKRAFEKLQFTMLGCDFGRNEKKIMPIIVVGEQMPVDFLNRALYENEARKDGVILKHKNLLPFIILTAEDVEGIEALAKFNPTLAEKYLIKYSKMLKVKKTRGKKRECISFKNFLSDSRINMPNNETLSAVFHDMAKDATKKIFNKNL